MAKASTITISRYGRDAAGKRVHRLEKVDPARFGITGDFLAAEREHVVNKHVQRIKSACRARILSRYSLEKQANMTRELALLSARAERGAAEDRRMAELAAAFDWIDACRARSKAMIAATSDEVRAIMEKADAGKPMKKRARDVVDATAGSIGGKGAWPQHGGGEG